MDEGKSDTKAMLLEQYKLYVEMADRVSARRAETNKFYTTLITGLLVLIPVVSDLNVLPVIQKIAFELFGLLGLALCIVWVINIRSYKELNSLKFAVIHEIEVELPFQAYKREWELLKQDSNRTYTRLSIIEQYVPIILATPHFIVLIIALLG